MKRTSIQSESITKTKQTPGPNLKVCLSCHSLQKVLRPALLRHTSDLARVNGPQEELPDKSGVSSILNFS
jgi:hypothetical protein